MLVLVGYGVIPTLQRGATFGRVYAYGGIFVVLSLLWGWGVRRTPRPLRLARCRAGLTDDGVPTARNGDRWRPSTVQRVCAERPTPGGSRVIGARSGQMIERASQMLDLFADIFPDRGATKVELRNAVEQACDGIQ